MLLEKTEQIIKDLNNLKILQDSSSQSKRFSKRVDKLKDITRFLENLVSIVELFRKQKIEVDVKNILAYPDSLFEKLKVKWKADGKSIIEPDDFFTKIKLNNIQNEIQEKLESQWKEFISEKRPSINISQLNVLKNIPDFKIVVIELKEKLEIINELKEKFPNKDADFELILSTTKEMTNLWEKLSSKDIPEPMMEFLKKAGSFDGVKLSEITPEILKWLNDNNLTHLCQVRFKK
ncbi:hypothetical protein MNB_SV-12-1227 [hydrothermal vent metagenome]|uniref:Uncharacterized protein n=1 Tax=hydrothermal vent metagenome TaxID=652676 RepID=A0A1W1CI53_9ZZZZ